MLILTLIATFILSCGHFCNLLHCQRGNWFTSSWNKRNISANSYNLSDSNSVIQLQHPFFDKLLTVTDILSSKASICFCLFLSVLYVTSSTLYECGNELAHWSMSYFQIEAWNEILILFMAIVYNIGITYLFYYLFFQFHEISVKFQFKKANPKTKPQYISPSVPMDKSPKNKNGDNKEDGDEKEDIVMSLKTTPKQETVIIKSGGNNNTTTSILNVSSPNNYSIHSSMGGSPPDITISDPSLTGSTTMMQKPYDIMAMSKDFNNFYASWKFFPMSNADNLAANTINHDPSILTLNSESSSFNVLVLPLWAQRLFSVVYALIFILLWLFTLFCVFIYFLFATLPNNNNLKVKPSLLPFSHYGMATIFSFNNIFIIPRVADCFVLAFGTIYNFMTKKNQIEDGQFLKNEHKIRSICIILLRSITNILLPIFFSLLLLNGCGGYWKLFWSGCYPESPYNESPSKSFTVNVNTTYSNEMKVKPF